MSEQIIKKWTEAFNNADWETVASLYTDDTVGSDPTGATYTGREENLANDKIWRNLSLSQRCYNINKLRKALVKNKDLIHKTLKAETGKPDFDILIEIFTTLEHLKEISKIAKKALKPSSRNSGLMKIKKAYVKYEPLGIAGVISPWNYPLATPITSSIEALLAGNSVILKPSEHTPQTSILIKKI